MELKFYFSPSLLCTQSTREGEYCPTPPLPLDYHKVTTNLRALLYNLDEDIFMFIFICSYYCQLLVNMTIMLVGN